jgi:2-methylcitrate dehydratase PrpD
MASSPEDTRTSATDNRSVQTLAEFVASASVPPDAREAAQAAFLDTVGVTLAGAVEPGARIVQRVVAAEGGAPQAGVFGTDQRTSASGAALANGTAAHALDYDDMFFMTLSHPSAPLVAAGLAVGELVGASGRTVLEAYVVGFEVGAILGQAMNPQHYQRGWHATSTIGTVAAAAAVARILQLDPEATLCALSIAASEASGLKENFGTMVKPLHAGLASRNAVLAGLLAKEGFTASDRALEGDQGMLTAMDGSQHTLEQVIGRVGHRWEILETGITVKLYPSCAATHPPLDALLHLRRAFGFEADEVEAVEIAVDEMTPTVLIYDQPTTGLEGKFSLQLCAAAAIVDGRVGIDTFEDAHVRDPRIQEMRSRVTMRVDPSLGRNAPSLSQARVAVHLRDGRSLALGADGARGYPENPASDQELETKFRSCAARALPESAVDQALAALRSLDTLDDIREATGLLVRS